MTRIAVISLTGTENDYLYYIIAPSLGANDVVTTTSSSTTIYADSLSYTGAKQSAQPNAFNSQTGTSVLPFYTSVTTTDDNCWLVGFIRSTGAQVAGTDTTFRGGVNSTAQIADSN